MVNSNITDDMYRVSLDGVIYGSYVKLDRLSNIVYNAFGGTSIASATELNIFIDIYSVIHQLFSEHYRVDYVNYTDITSCLINMCAHYRAFFRTLRVNTTFYLVFSTNCCDINRKFVSGYNEIFYNKTLIPESKKITNDNFKLLSALCPYLPDIHFIKSDENFEVGVMIANLIETLNDGKPNLIISKDLYPIQLTSMYPNTTYLYPRKNKIQGDISYLIPVFEKANYRNEFWNLIGEMRHIKADNLYKISPINYSLLASMNNFIDRNMKTLYNVNACAKLIYSLVGSEDIKINISQLNTPEIANNFNVSLIESRYKAIDISFMLPYYRNTPECKNIKLVNLRDDSIINQINSKYFKNNPIDLNRL